MAKVIYTGLRVMQCCGVREVIQLSYQQTDDYKVPFKDLVRKLQADGAGISCGALVFTQAVTGNTYGKEFADNIVKHKLGKVIEAPAFRNPNSRNMVTTWVWVIDRDALTAFVTKSDKPAAPRPPKVRREIPTWSK